MCPLFVEKATLDLYHFNRNSRKNNNLFSCGNFSAGHTHAVFIQRVSGCLNYVYMYFFTFCFQSPTKEPDICEYLRICNNCHQTKKQKQVQDIVDGQVDQVGLSVSIIMLQTTIRRPASVVHIGHRLKIGHCFKMSCMPNVLPRQF